MNHRPKSFDTPQGRAVFVDFLTADYDIVYNLNQKKASITATIKFYAPEAGFPVFDSFETPSLIALNEEGVEASLVSTPDKETTVRVMNKAIAVGEHVAIITVPLTSLVEFSIKGVKSAFWTSDLAERQFLERYMPANLEFDQVKMTFSVSFVGGQGNQKIYTNGIVSENKRENSFKITYPDYYNSSAIFFHTVPEGSTNELRFTLKSIDGREIPSVVYIAKTIFGGSGTLEKLKKLTTEVFNELESDYGAWPHPTIVIYNAGAGGMEYCGATMTSISALGHELFHFYFARGVMPANGNAGWLDEALASWRDDGYPTLSTLSGSSMMSSHPYYTRTTDRAAYTFGARFMSFMDGKLKSNGGLKPFMRDMVDKKMFAPFFVEEFIKGMSDFYGVSVEEDFKQYTFGKTNNFTTNQKSHSHLMHQKMSLEELKAHL
jgi:hypothetical protein